MAKTPELYLARHGETEWTIARKHTSVTDLPLTAAGEEDGRLLGRRLQGLTFAQVLTSPLQRARRTCELAGFGGVMIVEPQLTEWNYGEYEGKTTAEIHAQLPQWDVFRDGCPGGESVAEVAARADAVAARLRELDGNALIFSHGHFLRVLAARWLGLEARVGTSLLLTTGSLSILGYEHGFTDPAIRLWNAEPLPGRRRV